MSSQHDQPHTPVSRISGAACAWIVAACIAGAVLLLLSAFDFVGETPLPRGVAVTLAAFIAVCGCGYIVRTAEDRVNERLDRIEAAIAHEFIDPDAAAAARRINFRLLSGN